MFREQTRRQLCDLAKNGPVPNRAKVSDSYYSTLSIGISNSGDISLEIAERYGHDTRLAGCTFVGVGGGDDRPLTKEALRLLAIALQEEGDVR